MKSQCTNSNYVRHYWSEFAVGTTLQSELKKDTIVNKYPVIPVFVFLCVCVCVCFYKSINLSEVSQTIQIIGKEILIL